MPRITIWPPAMLTRPRLDSPLVTTPLRGSTVARVDDSKSAPPFPDEDASFLEFVPADDALPPGSDGTVMVGVDTVGVDTVVAGTVGTGGTGGFEPGADRVGEVVVVVVDHDGRRTGRLLPLQGHRRAAADARRQVEGEQRLPGANEL